MATTATFSIWRGEGTQGKCVDYTAEISEGMVVLDAVHQIQATQANDLACRWNCKAGKCGSCSAEINGRPRLLCMTRMSTFDENETVTISTKAELAEALRVAGAAGPRYRGCAVVARDVRPARPPA